MKKIEIYDTTLRDGAQSAGINFSVSDKLKIINLIDSLGIDYIEAGWPGANPKDVEVFSQIKKLKLKHSKITAFGSTRKANICANDDVTLNLLSNCDVDIVTIFGKTWDFHVTNALNTTLEENLNMIFESISYLKEKGKTVFFDAEHFFDGYKNNQDYAIACIEKAYLAGAERLILCDTNGANINNFIYTTTKHLIEIFPEANFGIHAHNDSELAVANSIASIEAGAIQVQGTMNGYGERCGNTNLCSIIPNLQLKNNYEIIGDKIKKITFVANSIAEISNVTISPNQPYVGRNAFAHKAGIHASGIMKNSKTYEHISPEDIGNERKILVSDQSGITSIKDKIENLKFISKISDEDIKKILERLKTLEWQGYAFEGADASFELLIMEVLGIEHNFFDLLGFRIIADTIGNANTLNTEASVKIDFDEKIIHTVSEGDGPVNALDVALKKALIPIYPVVLKFKLDDFKVRILDSKGGTAAQVRVNIETTDGFNRWDTVGVSTNIIEASYKAITDSLIYGLLIHKED